MKTIIGICADYCYGLDEIYNGLGSKLNWQIAANDFVKVVEEVGGVPLIIPVFTNRGNIENAIDIVDGIIFAGGADIEPKYYGEEIGPEIGEVIPERDAQELYLAKKIINKSNVPILGVCRGYQLLNVACGGTLYQDLCQVSSNLKNNSTINHSVIGSPKYNTVHKVLVNEKSKLHKILNRNTLEVNSYHHQAIKDVASIFNVAAMSPDGIVEAIEMKEDRFILGTQWHPEMLEEKHCEQLLIFKAFIEACRKNKISRKSKVTIA
ncbi:gamma-glutamyl-gamma-aminobutyrate hydrolase family protein [Clostridium coskatii]|uniref:Glutamine amidotransferasec n=1 Tax=Clostridium coskatii TaxID=1705578 RepID=A0A166UEH2_9CLOT|nr:gamma-glutamyl-gamma-aminobutyrate hydrolase family protein [Clostridium coskatii]OAA94847.1 putative glutamine amidotransferase [Clostridium coskatii]OBR93795.1 putative glutamine amidotransferasec [Clostridium coskatii]